MKRIALLTSGGDAPGMNAAIRAIVRVGNYSQADVFGIRHGYQGLLTGEFVSMDSRSVSNIIQRGGTILKTSRSEEFKTPEGLKQAKRVLEENKIDGLIVIGGDGTYRGAQALGKIWSGRLIGVPATIDNDVDGTENTIGFDTAVNTALEGIDKIRDTAEAHEKIFLVEVMGKAAGFIALEVGIGGGAEEILLPEVSKDISTVCKEILKNKQKGKNSSIIVVAEGEKEGRAFEVAEKFRSISKIDCRVVVLGHLQRGGSPTAFDRMLATELGAYAYKCLEEGQTGFAVGKQGKRFVLTPFAETWKKKKSLDPFLIDLIPALAY